ncbi:TraR/DksA C4-type zinc finger protein [Ferdinandcohnia quinoae]|uniref:TraR/DksA family transcriptional regulator n=1 Tax=Fredinandcohnia quinoae TaxID=2918902 RepID=A0AAW5DXT3_9BACI|nr:TraR/DksA C4-type zinc finger protein [Fredinandcohnia sp. SECRCQ15]MCH1623855.1 TraR/DksA family transcriptional regulator [Fredinandcohnia sp. SECRCQ15]
MNDQYAEIKSELELTKRELLTRLAHSTHYEVSSEPLYESNKIQKEKIVIHHIREDLRDVELALQKMDYGAYGICEETGDQIPFDKLRILPTARSIFEFSFSELFETTFPQKPKTNLYLLEQK